MSEGDISLFTPYINLQLKLLVLFQMSMSCYQFHQK